MLGVGSIPSAASGTGSQISQSTNVPANGAYILSEDQTGASSQFASNSNAWDYSGGKSTFATYNESFLTLSGNYATAEQDSLTALRLTGVCSGSSGGCTGSFGTQTSVYEYKLFSLSQGDNNTGSFIPTAVGQKVSRTSPTYYWLRSPKDDYSYRVRYVSAASGGSSFDTSSGSYGFRPAGVLNLESVLLSESRTDSRSEYNLCFSSRVSLQEAKEYHQMFFLLHFQCKT